jgi:hypothetical protein
MLYSMFAMILLTAAVSARLLSLRINAIKNGKVSLGQFRLNSGDMPNDMAQASRNYSNLFEIPVLFYAAGTLALALQLQSITMIILSWTFIASRILHSWIHLTYNNVIHRFRAFLAGNICVVTIWVLIVWEYTVR